MKLYSDHILIGSAFQSGTLEFDERFSIFTPGMKPSSMQNTGSGCTEENGRPGARGKGAEGPERGARGQRMFWTTAVFISSPDWWTSTPTRRWGRTPVTETTRKCRQ